MKESLEKKYSDSTIEASELESYKKMVLIKRILLTVAYLGMILYSLIKIKKNAIYFGVLGKTQPIFYGVGLVLFFITIYLVFCYSIVSLFYILYKIYRKEEWISAIHKINVKGDIYIFICKCLSILLFIMIYITTPCTVQGDSMNPTFVSGEKVLCSDLFYQPKKDDIVIFDAINYTRDDSFYIKRVTAVEGDTVSCDREKKMVYINEEYYSDITISAYDIMQASAGFQDLDSFQLPEGYVMVLGDNRGSSYDSRRFGLIHKEDIFGRVYIRILPVNRIKTY